MKLNLNVVAVAILVSVGSWAQTAQAQGGALMYAQVTVPFSFDFGAAHFSEGVYDIRLENHVLMIRNGRKAGLVLIQPEHDPTPMSRTAVGFRKYGNRYFLNELWIANAHLHVILPQSQGEKHAAREWATRGEIPAELAVALLPERPLGK